MPDGTAVAAITRRRPATVALATAAFAWPPVAVAFGALALFALVGDHIRLSRLDPAIVPESWNPADFGAALGGWGFSAVGYAIGLDAAKSILLASFFGAAYLAWGRRHADPAALLVAYFLVAFAANWEVDPARMPAVIQPLVAGIDVVAWSAFVNFFLLFPDGRYRPRWSVFIGLGMPVLAVAAAIAQAPAPVQMGAFAFCLLIAVAAQAVRYRRHHTPVQKQQTRWLLLGFGATAGLMVVTLAVGALLNPRPPAQAALGMELWGQAIGQFGFIPIPLAIAVAVTRHGLWDMERVLNRAIVYGVLTVAVIAIYAIGTLAVGTQLTIGAGPISTLFAIALIAVLLQPARHWLQRAVNRALYGSRDDPYSALAGLGRRLRDNLAPEAALEVIAATVRRSLRVSYVEVRVGDGLEHASAGSADDRHLHCVPVRHLGRAVGEIRVSARPGEHRLSEPDLRLLSDLAQHAGAAMHEEELRRQLRDSREALVVAREEERRRLSRVLHDDIGANLAAQKLTAGALAATSADANVRGTATRMETELAGTIRRLRELAYELRPPALEDGGIREALEDLVARQRTAGLDVTFESPAVYPALPAAVELALYRVAEQALANVQRHSGATRCRIRLTFGDKARLCVEDNGTGMAAPARPGVGLKSMRERTEELGGSLDMAPGSGGGTAVNMTIPLTRR